MRMLKPVLLFFFDKWMNKIGVSKFLNLIFCCYRNTQHNARWIVKHQSKRIKWLNNLKTEFNQWWKHQNSHKIPSAAMKQNGADHGCSCLFDFDDLCLSSFLILWSYSCYQYLPLLEAFTFHILRKWMIHLSSINRCLLFSLPSYFFSIFLNYWYHIVCAQPPFLLHLQQNILTSWCSLAYWLRFSLPSIRMVYLIESIVPSCCSFRISIPCFCCLHCLSYVTIRWLPCIFLFNIGHLQHCICGSCWVVHLAVFGHLSLIWSV